MNGNEHNPSPESEPRLEPALESSLRGLYGGAGTLPPALDSAVMRLAGERAAIVRRKRAWYRFAGRAAAVAAAAGLALAAVIIPRIGTSPAVPAAAALAAGIGDVNGDGVVDILDALALATRLEELGERTAHLPAGWDANGDGVIDHRDAETIAQRAVRLEGRG
jgi:hypothetical protein